MAVDKRKCERCKDKCKHGGTWYYSLGVTQLNQESMTYDSHVVDKPFIFNKAYFNCVTSNSFCIRGVRYKRAVPEAQTKYEALQAESKAKEAIFTGR